VPMSGHTSGGISSSQTKLSQSLSGGQGVKVPAHVYQAVANASAKVGVSFAYLMDKAGTESSFNPNAQARTSSASGLYQFIERTWLDMVNKHGADYGLEKYANAISKRSDGTLTVSSRAMRQEILALRKDPTIASYMAAEYAKENKQALEKNLGRAVGDTELYLAHFLGAGGATRFLKAMERNPNATAASLLPEAAQANQNVFYSSRTGHAQTLAQIYNRFEDKFDNSTTYVADGTTLLNKGIQLASAALGLNDKPDNSGDIVVAGVSKTNAPGAIAGSLQPFISSYLLTAFDGGAEGDGEHNDRNTIPSYAGSLYQAANTPQPQPAFVGFV